MGVLLFDSCSKIHFLPQLEKLPFSTVGVFATSMLLALGVRPPRIISQKHCHLLNLNAPAMWTRAMRQSKIYISSKLPRIVSWIACALLWCMVNLIRYKQICLTKAIEIVVHAFFADTLAFEQEQKFRFVVYFSKSWRMAQCKLLLS